MIPKKSWIGASLFAGILLFSGLFAPAIFAETGDSKSSARYLQLFDYVYSFIERNYVDEVDPAVLYKGALKGMLDSLGDPYSTYVTEESLLGTDLKDTTTGAFGGVGLSITKPTESTAEKPAWVEVASPIEDTPGWKAGVQPGDIILSIDGTATPDITMAEVLSLLRGPVGTNVTVQLRRGKNLEFPVTLTRALIEVPTVKFAMMDKGIGYLRIIEFTPLTAPRVQDALDSFKKAGYKTLIIDVRNNPGGLITSVGDVADKFIESGMIVSTRSRYGKAESEITASPGKTTFRPHLPTVVLLNKGSASAAEILAGALKDHHLAYLVGETSYGKGSVQQVIDLFDNDQMKLTMARYYTPSGANIDKKGIVPDREVLLPALTEAEEKALADLLTTTTLTDLVAGRETLSSAEADSLAADLAKKWPVSVRVLKKLVMQEYYRTHISPLYDLDYDVQLKSAVDILLNEDVNALLKTTKTVLEVQEAATLAATVTGAQGSGGIDR